MRPLRFSVLIVDLIASLFSVVFLTMMAASLKVPEVRFEGDVDQTVTTRNSRYFKLISAQWDLDSSDGFWCNDFTFEKDHNSVSWLLIMDDRIVMYDREEKVTDTVYPNSPRYHQDIASFLDNVNMIGGDAREPLFLQSVSFKLYYDVRDKLQLHKNISWCDAKTPPNSFVETLDRVADDTKPIDLVAATGRIKEIVVLSPSPTATETQEAQKVRDQNPNQMWIPTPNVAQPSSRAQSEDTIDLDGPPLARPIPQPRSILPTIIACALLLILGFLAVTMIGYRRRNIL